MASVSNQEYHIPHTTFRQMTGLTNYEIEQMGIQFDYARKNDKGIPIFGMVKALNESKREMADKFGVNVNSDTDDAKYDHKLKWETLVSKRILNQMKLGVLIPKEEAAERVKVVFRAVINIIKVGIKHSATRIMAMTITNPRDIEVVLTEGWNDAITTLRDKSEIISWEEDGSHVLLQTRLESVAGQDLEFAEALEARKKHEKS